MSKVKWVCESCKANITTYVKLVEAPTHSCPKKANRTIPLKEEE